MMVMRQGLNPLRIRYILVYPDHWYNKVGMTWYKITSITTTVGWSKKYSKDYNHFSSFVARWKTPRARSNRKHFWPSKVSIFLPIGGTGSAAFWREGLKFYHLSIARSRWLLYRGDWRGRGGVGRYNEGLHACHFPIFPRPISVERGRALRGDLKVFFWRFFQWSWHLRLQ